MSKHALMSHGPLADAAERQLRLHAVGTAVSGRVDHELETAAGPRIRPHVCISREEGAGGEEIGDGVARALRWHLLDRNLLHNLAAAGTVSESLLRIVDERRGNWLSELLTSWEQMGGINQRNYVLRLGEFLTTVVKNVPAVIVGRGAHRLLPRDSGLSVRIIAPRTCRVERLMQARNMRRTVAEREIDEIDSARNEFVRRYFLCDPTDPLMYDFQINTGRVSLDEAAAMIVGECRRRFGI